MKILYSCLSKSWGGMEMVTINSIKQLLDRNISVELICTAESRIHIEANNIEALAIEIEKYIKKLSGIHKKSKELLGQFKKKDPAYGIVNKILKESEIK